MPNYINKTPVYNYVNTFNEEDELKKMKKILIIDTREKYSEISISGNTLKNIKEKIGSKLCFVSNYTRKGKLYDCVIVLDSENYFKFWKIVKDGNVK